MLSSCQKETFLFTFNHSAAQATHVMSNPGFCHNVSNVFWLPPSSPLLLTTAPHHAHFGRRKPYHWSNCVFMTTIRKIIDNHSRCHCHHHRGSNGGSRLLPHAKRNILLLYHVITIITQKPEPPPRFYHLYQKMELLGLCTEILQPPPLFIEGGIAEERGRHNLGSQHCA